MDEGTIIVFAVVVALVGFILSRFKFFTVVETGSSVVMERLGKFHKVLDAGVHFLIPIIDSPKRVHWTRVEESRIGANSVLSKKSYFLSAVPTVEQVHDLPEFQSSTKDRIDVYVNGLIFFRIQDVKKAVYNINDLYAAIENLVETAIRQYTSTASLEECFVSRDKITAQVVHSLSDCEDSWGIKLVRFDIQEIKCSPQVRKATEASVLKHREAESRLAMAEANKKAQLLEMQAQNEVNFSRSKAEAELKLNAAEMQRKLAAVNQQMALEETENSLKQRRMEQEESSKTLVLQFEAEAEGLKRLLQVPGITMDYLRQRNQLEAWAAMASNPNNKIVLPYNSVPLLGAQALMHSLTQDSSKEE
jgi:regulator of protease activity HflC (stomatin/prohibitin superfamily)